MSGKDNLRRQLETALQVCARLREENSRLRQLLRPAQPLAEKAGPAANSSSPVEEKIKLFRSLFRGREDVFARRWESRNGRSGYSPACAYEWDPKLCAKPGGKCTNCRFLPVSDEVIFDHLSGKHVVGVYPLLQDESCRFLAADFDKESWMEDAAEFLRTCSEMGIPAALERSRSGRGGHVWIFFQEPLTATVARKLGCAVLTQTMERRHQIGLDSYDRFFPSQDTMPKGGVGNLIALPLQSGPRRDGNSIFLDDGFHPHKDQWAFLCSIKKLTSKQAHSLVEKAARQGRVMGVRLSLVDEDLEEDPWTLSPSGKKREARVEGVFPEKVRIVQSDQLYIEKHGLPSGALNRLSRMASFQNPEFYKAQSLRLSTFGKPRVICCAQDSLRYLALPRGCLPEVKDFFSTHAVSVQIEDERFSGSSIDVCFQAKLQPLQEQAAQAVLQRDEGVLSATTGFGKTVVAASVIAARGVNALVLVHRRQLLDQWRERLAIFLDLPLDSLGQIGGGKEKRTGIIDVAMFQSLNRKGCVRDWVSEYGHVVIDECHHVSAFSFEQVLRKVKARFILGLTATPIRRDGHHPIIFMQCGPLRFRTSPREQARRRPFEHVVVPRLTSFELQSNDISIQEVYSALISDQARNDLIFDDLIACLEAKRSPLVLTERVEQLDEFAGRLKNFAKNVIVFRGRMSTRQRLQIRVTLAAIPDAEERVILATGKYIGEGFDDARLDTLFLALPISWRGTLHQYVGRLHRVHANKREVRVYDYVDANVPVLQRMYQRRRRGYTALGYTIRSHSD